MNLLVYHIIWCPGFSDEMLELLLFALEDLRRVLKEQGSDLLIVYGAAEKAVIELVKKVFYNYFYESIHEVSKLTIMLLTCLC